MKKIIGKQPAGSAPEEKVGARRREPVDEAQIERERREARARAAKMLTRERIETQRAQVELAARMGRWAAAGELDRLASALASVRADLARGKRDPEDWAPESRAMLEMWRVAGGALKPAQGAKAMGMLLAFARPSPSALAAAMAAALPHALSTEALDFLEQSGAVVGEERLGSELNDACRLGRAEGAAWIYKRMPPAERATAGGAAAVVAAQRGVARCMVAMWDLGVEVDARSYSGFTALLSAAHEGRQECVELALARGASVELRDTGGRAALGQAAGKGHLGCLEAIAAAGASLEDVDNNGWTPAMLAAQRGSAPCVEFLAKQGADFGRTDPKGDLPADMARAAGKKDLADWIEARQTALEEARALGQAADSGRAARPASRL